MSQRRETILVEDHAWHDRLDVYLRTRFPAVSRVALQRLIEQGHIQVNGRKVKPTYRPLKEDEIEVQWPEPRPSTAQAEAIPLEILFEDEVLLVLNKPPGIVVHPAAGHEEHTLVNALLHHCQGQLSGIGGVARPGIVHRLDKDTSGCLLVAKNDATHLALSEQFSSREVGKIYHALVCGHPKPSQGEIVAAIARHPSHRKKMAVTRGRGRAARTSYKVIENFPSAALVEAVLHTGRTHQIRVHFQHAGFPLAGDGVYGLKQNRQLTQSTEFSAPRQMLHASRLVFLHPLTGRQQSCEAPWPHDFQQAMAELRKNRK